MLAGAFFTLAGPALFIFLARIAAPVIASVTSEVSMHSIRCVIYNRFVFTGAQSGVLTYLTAAIPASLLNVCLVYYLQSSLVSWQIAIVIALQSATLGYLWSRACYSFNLSLRIRTKRK
jgi:hypothetical protein